MSIEEVSVLVWVLLVPLILSVICALKGKYWFAVVSFFLVGILGWFGAIRLAKPGSRWARGYDRDKLARSMNRFPQQAAKQDPNWVENVNAAPDRAVIEDIGEWPAENPLLWDKITRKAYKKQHGYWPENSPARQG